MKIVFNLSIRGEQRCFAVSVIFHQTFESLVWVVWEYLIIRFVCWEQILFVLLKHTVMKHVFSHGLLWWCCQWKILQCQASSSIPYSTPFMNSRNSVRQNEQSLGFKCDTFFLCYWLKSKFRFNKKNKWKGKNKMANCHAKRWDFKDRIIQTIFLQGIL